MIAAATLLPIAPLFLLPFILVFFVAVFPIWLVAMMILGAVRWVARRLSGTHPATRSIDRAFRWVMTFGGLIHLEKEASSESK
jgi:hypothetical protein